MAAERLTILIDEKGARVVERNIDNIGKAADKTGKKANLMKSALRFLSVGVLIKEYIEMSNVFQNMRNRLSLFTDSAGQVTAAQKRLLDISNRTRADFAATAEVYSRVALASKDLGISQEALFQFTENLNKAVIVSGATAQESKNAMIQLSQGMAAGALRGDELRSVLEQLPAVADVIASQLKVTRGELKKMGEDGRITSEIILKAFREQEDEINSQFARTVPTIAQSWTVLKNNILAAIGAFNQATSTAAKISELLLWVSENLESVVRLAAGLALRATFARAIPMVVAFGRGLRAAFTLSGIGPFLVLLTKILAFFAIFISDIQVAHDRSIGWADLFAALIQKVSQGFETMRMVMSQFVADLLNLGPDFKITFQDIVTYMAIMADSAIHIFLIMGNSIRKGFALAVDAVFKAMRQLVGGLRHLIDFLPKDIAQKIFGESKFAQLKRQAEEADKLRSIRTEIAGKEYEIKQLHNDQIKVVSKYKELGDNIARQQDYRIQKEKAEAERDLRHLKEKEKAIKASFGGPLTLAGEESRKASKAIDESLDVLKGKTVGFFQGYISDLFEIAGKESDKRGGLAGPGKKRGGPSDEDPSKYVQKTLQSYEQLLASINPVYGALLKQEKAEKLLNEAVELGLISGRQRTFVLERVNEKLEDALNPAKAMRKELEKEHNLLLLDEPARKDRVKYLEIEGKLKSKDANATQEQVQQLFDLYKANEAIADQQKRDAEYAKKKQGFIASLQGSEVETAKNNLRLIADLVEENGGKTKDLENAWLEANAIILASSTNMYDNLKAGLIGYYLEINNTGKLLLESMKVAAEAFETAIVDTVLAVEVLIYDAVTDMENAWKNFGDNLLEITRSFVRTLLREITRLIVKILLARALASSLGGGINLPGTVSATSSEAGDNLLRPGFKTGGSFIVGGSGGPDTQMVAFRATPGERVDISTKDQQRQESKMSGGSSEPPIVKNVVVLSPEDMVAALGTSQGEQAVLQIVGNNRTALKRMLK